MDIKWKNNRIGQENLEKIQRDSEETYSEGTVNEEFLENLYKGCYVLYKEETERKSGEIINGSELFIGTYPGKGEVAETEEEAKDAVQSYINEVIEEWSEVFDAVEIVMKNMSAEELNIDAEEITERFVRGDSSRNTEGSGLGLAIAKSFTEAQGGKFRIEVDGDLFKAVLEFPLA